MTTLLTREENLLFMYIQIRSPSPDCESYLYDLEVEDSHVRIIYNSTNPDYIDLHIESYVTTPTPVRTPFLQNIEVQTITECDIYFLFNSPDKQTYRNIQRQTPINNLTFTYVPLLIESEFTINEPTATTLTNELTATTLPFSVTESPFWITNYANDTNNDKLSVLWSVPFIILTCVRLLVYFKIMWMNRKMHNHHSLSPRKIDTKILKSRPSRHRIIPR